MTQRQDLRFFKYLMYAQIICSIGTLSGIVIGVSGYATWIVAKPVNEQFSHIGKKWGDLAIRDLTLPCSGGNVAIWLLMSRVYQRESAAASRRLERDSKSCCQYLNPDPTECIFLRCAVHPERKTCIGCDSEQFFSETTSAPSVQQPSERAQAED